MDPFDEIRYLGWNLEEVEDFEYSPSHSTLSDRLKKTLYLAEGRSEVNGISLPVADTAVEIFQGVSGSPLKKISPRHVANLSKRSRVAPCTLLLAMIYARRLKMTNENYVQNMNSADLLLVSMMVASKFLYDEGEDEEMFSDEWAKAANMDLNHVYELEREFLKAMDWNLFVHGEEFFEFIRQIETRIALNQGVSRGWFSYSDMEVLMAQPSWQDACYLVFQQGVKVLGLCIAVYTLCATSIIWSSLVLHHVQVQYPSGCNCIPLTLDSHIKKCTLMHHHPGEAGPILAEDLPSDPEICQCKGSSSPKDSENGRQVDYGMEEGNTSTCNPNEEQFHSVWDMTATLHRKYHMAHQALIVFYQALMAAVNDISSHAELKCSASSDSVASCSCECNHSDTTSEGTIYVSGHQQQLDVLGTESCQCQCERGHKLGNSWKWSNSTVNEGIGRGAKSEPWINLSQWYLSLWSVFRGGGHHCWWSQPLLKHRYVDLEMRFATSSFLT